MCDHSMCDHSMCEHSMWAPYGDHYFYMWALYVWALYMWAPYVWPLYVRGISFHSTLVSMSQCFDRISFAHLHLAKQKVQSHWLKLAVALAKTTSMCDHSTEHPMCEHSMGALYVRGHLVHILWLDRDTTPPNDLKLFDISMGSAPPKYENYQETSTSVLGPDVAAPKTSKKPEFYCKNTGQEHWRTPKSTRITTKNEHGRSWRAEKVRKFTDETRFRPFQEQQTHEKYENYHEKWTSKKLKSRKLWKFTDKSRGRRSPPPENYENSQTKRTCKHETTKIAMKSVRNPSATF